MNNNMFTIAFLTLISVSYSYPAARVAAASVACRGLHVLASHSPAAAARARLFPVAYRGLRVCHTRQILLPRRILGNIVGTPYRYLHVPPTREAIEKIAYAQQQAQQALVRYHVHTALTATYSPEDINWSLNLSLANVAINEHKKWLDKAALLKKESGKTKD